MINKADDYDISSTDYDKYIEECRQSLTEIWNISNELGKSSGATKDPTLKQQFAVYEDVLNSSLPTKSSLDQMKKTFSAVHGFTIRLSTIGPDSSEADVQNAADILINSGSNDWINFGQGWQTRMLKLLAARRAYEDITYSDSQYSTVRQDYYNALDELQDYLDAIDDSEKWDNGGFHVNNIDHLEDEFYTLRSVIRTAYEQHYDGQNSENCTDFGGGEASCD